MNPVRTLMLMILLLHTSFSHLAIFSWRKYTKYGNAHAIVSPAMKTQKRIHTLDPENTKTVLVIGFNDYKLRISLTGHPGDSYALPC
ncbi:hypothetical protein F5Y06DRAFT_264366 [Hypoxylon sp. FL0890]|nr:hypothetical protein F5Y06DRAFT_264366 [Hypoxylon sp. FL0890]